VKTDINMAVL